MFLKLFWKECVQMVKSITYGVYVVVLVLFYVTQLGTFEPLTKPEPGQESYGGVTYSEDEAEIMAAALGALASDVENGSFTTYPFGFYKEVTPAGEEILRLKEILQEATGLSWEQLTARMEELEEEYQKSLEDGPRVAYGSYLNIPAADTLDYERFQELMEEVDSILGGGSSYAKESLSGLAVRPATYEDALSQYEEVVEQDKVTGAYARMFSDYMGIMAGILPVFLAVARSLKDRRAKAREVLWSRKASSVTMVLSRYLAAAAAGLLPILILAFSMNLQSMYCAKTLEVSGDALAFAKYVGGWILPTMLFTLSVGFLITEMTDSALAVLVQGAVWYLATMMTSGSLEHVGKNFIPRWNSLGMSGQFFELLPELIANRLAYTAAALVMALATVAVFDLKRKGVWRSRGNLLGNRKSTH